MAASSRPGHSSCASWESFVEELRRDGVSAQDYKSALQELVQARNRPLPEYRVVGAVGPDHQKLFDVEVLVAGEPLARATGPEQEGGGAGSRPPRARPAYLM